MNKLVPAIAALAVLCLLLPGKLRAQSPAIIYVDSAVASSGTGASWSSPLKTLSEGLWRAHTVSGPVQVWVRKGTYYPMLSPTVKAVSRDSSFVIRRNNIKIYGGFAGTESSVSARTPGANTTILSGELNTDGDLFDNCVHVVKIITYPVTAIDSSTVLDGLTITRGYANGKIADIDFTISGKPYKINSFTGGGLYVFCNGAGYSCTPHINNCTFLWNWARNGAPAVENDGADAVLHAKYTNCNFSYNLNDSVGAGAMSFRQSGGAVQACTFYGNGGTLISGAAIYSFDGSSVPRTLRLTSNVFTGNGGDQGGAVWVNTNVGNLYASNNVFKENWAVGHEGGAMKLMMGSGQDTIINNLFIQNGATNVNSDGGAILLSRGGNSFIVNNTFYGNFARRKGGAIRFADRAGYAQLFNNIFYKNTVDTVISDTSFTPGAGFVAQGNNVFGNTPPGFVNESDIMGPDGILGTNDDGLYLNPCSPYLNTGDNSKNALAKDISNNNRVFASFIDPGAYELQKPAFPGVMDTLKAGICDGDSLLFNGVYYKTAQTHTDSFYTAGGCDSFKTLVLTLKTIPAPTVSSPVHYCIGALATPLTAGGTAATDTLLWYTAASGGTGSKTAPVPNTTSAGTVICYVSCKSGAVCESERTALTVQVNPPAAMPVVISPVKYCIGTAAAPLTAGAADPGDVLLWYDAASGGTGSAAAPVPNTSVIGVTTWYVSSTSAMGCESPRVPVSVAVRPGSAPLVSLSPTDVQLCEGHHIMLYASPVNADYVYTWYKDGLNMALAATTTATPVGLAGIYNVQVVDTQGCTGKTNSVSVSFYPPVVKPVIIRTGTTLRLDHAYAQYQWYRNKRVIAGETGRAYILAFDGSYYATVMDANGCVSVSDTIMIASLGIDAVNTSRNFPRIYPNPAQDIVFIEAPEPVHVVVKDITGRVVSDLQNAMQVSLGNYADGIYLFYFTDGQNKTIGVAKVYKTSTR